ncbi:helix-turn-helix domain-containing protein [Paraliomyxa miuraensis]|uniref:helix-turn-helix domain-containing protein n=1 Tax=Paraliomyxa miuraensis TaxID=376150 RepID=UPI00224F91F8|nr:helix-turn-helix domain-containing protein [Paraliomyxa miuraensis]MCX4244272.1 helix-turn-helix domain-containing protein [Paraliomyxa miuraensis]
MATEPATHRPEPSSDVLTPKQAAKYLYLSHRTLETMRTRGGGPPFAKLGDGRSSRVLYRKGDLDAWIASRVRQSTTEG